MSRLPRTLIAVLLVLCGTGRLVAADVFSWPVIGAPTAAYAPETSWAFGGSGAGYVILPTDSLGRTSEVSFDVAYTLNRQWFGNVSATLYITHRWQLAMKVGYRYYPDRFYGVGMRDNNLLYSPEAYNSSSFTLSARPLCRISPRWHVGAAVDVRYEGQGLTPGAPWLQTAAGAVAMYDSRDNIYYPHHGMLLKVQALAVPVWNIGGAQTDVFGRFQLDCRYFVDVYKGLIFAFQGYADVLAGNKVWSYVDDGGNRVWSPVSVLLPALGGTDMLRGFYYGQYRDEALVAVQAEMRFPVYKILRGTVFAAAGNTCSLYNPLWTMPKVGYGLGLRLQFNSAGVNIRADVARNNYDNRWNALSAYSFYLTVKEAF